MGCQSTSMAIQCLGGYGYTEEYLPELFFRDARIHPIHEGTTTIQGMDLLGRKIVKDQGASLRLLMAEVTTTIEAATEKKLLKAQATALGTTLEKMGETTMKLSMMAMQGETETFLADASLYLEAFGTMVLGWQWLKQGLAALKGLEANSDSDFYQGKLLTFEYFFAYELPKTRGLLATLNQASGVTVKVFK